MKSVSIQELQSQFDDYLLQVEQTEEPVLILRNNEPVAGLVSITVLTQNASEQKAADPGSDATKALALSAFGMWANRDDLDDTWQMNRRAQWNSRWHDG